MTTTKNDLLSRYGTIWSAIPLSMRSPAGEKLQAAFVAFLKESAELDADPGAMEIDVTTLAARALMTTNLAAHSGTACPVCHAAATTFFNRSMFDELMANSTSAKKTGTH